MSPEPPTFDAATWLKDRTAVSQQVEACEWKLPFTSGLRAETPCLRSCPVPQVLAELVATHHREVQASRLQVCSF